LAGREGEGSHQPTQRPCFLLPPRRRCFKKKKKKQGGNRFSLRSCFLFPMTLRIGNQQSSPRKTPPPDGFNKQSNLLASSLSNHSSETDRQDQPCLVLASEAPGRKNLICLVGPGCDRHTCTHLLSNGRRPQDPVAAARGKIALTTPEQKNIAGVREWVDACARGGRCSLLPRPHAHRTYLLPNGRLLRPTFNDLASTTLDRFGS
jgi:hypothetical protein